MRAPESDALVPRDRPWQESLKLVQHVEGGTAGATAADTGPATPSNEYHLEFTFDADAPCAVTVHFFCEEIVAPDGTALHLSATAPRSSRSRFVSALSCSRAVLSLAISTTSRLFDRL